MAVGVTAVGAIAAGIWIVYQKLTENADQYLNVFRELAKGAKGDAASQATLAIEKFKESGSVALPLIGLGWAVALSFYNLYLAHHKDKEVQDVRRPAHLLGPLVFLDEAITRSKKIGAGDEKRFRATIHRIDKEEHEQCVPYVGFGAGDPKDVGRKWSNHCGLVGQVVRAGSAAGEVLHVQMKESIKDPDSYIGAMIEIFGYTKKQAKERASMRLSAIAVPINDGNPENVIAVLYCDSSERNFFDEETKILCVMAGMAIAKYVRTVY